MTRRDFALLAAAGPAGAGSAAAAIDLKRIPVRKAGKVEIVFNSPTPQPNGLQATPQGLWIIDQGAEAKASLVSYEGKLLQQTPTETDRPSGITFDGEALWIGSTYNREIVRCDPKTGKALTRRFTPGAGVIYSMVGDPPGRSTPVPPDKRPPRPAAAPAPAADSAAKPVIPPGTGAHGQEWRDGKLWMAVPPSREVYQIDPARWVVERKFPTAGNRPHGIGWEGKYLWVTDSNWNAFFKHDPETGAIVEKIQLAETDPLPHGMTIRDGWMWYCDDIGLVCRFRLSERS